MFRKNLLFFATIITLLFSQVQAQVAVVSSPIDPGGETEEIIPQNVWIPTWVSSQQVTEPRNLPPSPGLKGNTIRETIRPTLCGTRLRVIFSNTHGDGPLTIDGAHIARSLGDSKIDPASDVQLLFNGKPGKVIQPGSIAYSDAIDFEVSAFQNLAVSILASSVPKDVTGHPGSRTTSYIINGDALSAAEFSDSVQTDHWYLLSSIEVWAAPESEAIVVLGDSITDGRGSTTNMNNRWPDILAERLKANPATRHIAVLNQGVGGGCVLRGGLGVPALVRFDRDVIAQPRVKWLILLIGVNDVGGNQGKDAEGLTDDLIAAFRQMIIRAHSHDIKVIGGTIMPFKGNDYDSPEREANRVEVDEWIRSCGEFDAVIDFDAITRSADDPTSLSTHVDCGDHLHPSVEGHRIMGEAVDLQLFVESE